MNIVFHTLHGIIHIWVAYKLLLLFNYNVDYVDLLANVTTRRLVLMDCS